MGRAEMILIYILLCRVESSHSPLGGSVPQVRNQCRGQNAVKGNAKTEEKRRDRKRC